MATMKDIAKMADISTATVSCALIHPEKVSTPTCQKVEQAMPGLALFLSWLVTHYQMSEIPHSFSDHPDTCDPFFANVIQ